MVEKSGHGWPSPYTSSARMEIQYYKKQKGGGVVYLSGDKGSGGQDPQQLLGQRPHGSSLVLHRQHLVHTKW